jgi:hypothetical protein
MAAASLVACARGGEGGVRPVPGPDGLALASLRDAGAREAQAAVEDGGMPEAYTRDVWVVMTPPSPMFLLATFDEVAGDGCEARLLAHARTLGANRLYIDRDVACGGRAYFERALAKPSEASLTLRGNVRPSDTAISDWVRARWRRPAQLSDAASRGLCVVVQFTVSPMRRVLEVRGAPIRPSGNAEFDESVRAAIESAIAEMANVPVPPRDFAGEPVAYRLEFTEGDPRLCR